MELSLEFTGHWPAAKQKIINERTGQWIHILKPLGESGDAWQGQLNAVKKELRAMKKSLDDNFQQLLVTIFIFKRQKDYCTLQHKCICVRFAPPLSQEIIFFNGRGRKCPLVAK